MSFSGVSKGAKRSISLGGKSKKTKLTRRELLDAARKKREQRARLRALERSSVVAQSLFRRRLSCRSARSVCASSWDKKVGDIVKAQTLLKTSITLPLNECLSLVREFNFFFEEGSCDRTSLRRSEQVATHVIKNLSGQPQQSLYAAAFHAQTQDDLLRHRLQLLRLLGNLCSVVLAFIGQVDQVDRSRSGSHVAAPAATQLECLVSAIHRIATAKLGPNSELSTSAARYDASYALYLVEGPRQSTAATVPMMFYTFAEKHTVSDAGATLRAGLLNAMVDLFKRTTTVLTNRSISVDAKAHAHSFQNLLLFTISTGSVQSQDFTRDIFSEGSVWNIFFAKTNCKAFIESSSQRQQIFMLRNLLDQVKHVVVTSMYNSLTSSLQCQWTLALHWIRVLVQVLPSAALLGVQSNAKINKVEDDSDDDDDEDDVDERFTGQTRFVKSMFHFVNTTFQSAATAKQASTASVRATASRFWIAQLQHTRCAILDDAGVLPMLRILCHQDFVTAANAFLNAAKTAEQGNFEANLLELGQIYADVLMRTVLRNLESALLFRSSLSSFDQQFKLQLLTALSWKPSDAEDALFVRLWRHIAGSSPPAAIASTLCNVMTQHFGSALSALNSSFFAKLPTDSPNPNSAIVGCAFLFFVTYLFALEGCSDHEFHTKQVPLRLDETPQIVIVVRDLLYKLLWRSAPPTSLNWMEKMMSAVACALFNQLYSRDCRRSFVAGDTWQWPPLPSNEMNKTTLTLGGSTRAKLVLTTLPQVIPFELRAAMYSNQLHAMRSTAATAMLSRLDLTVRRDMLFEDAQRGLAKHFRGLAPSQQATLLKQRMRISFVDVHGRAELGIDGGGLFKEFVDEVNKKAFEHNWNTTPGEKQLYPADTHLLSAAEVSSQDFTFMGQMLGLAMFNMISVEPVFANFFLKKLLGQRPEIDDLYSLDPELYTHLMSLRTADDDELDDVDQRFEVTRDCFGAIEHIPLVDNGSNIKVTKDNLDSFIVKLADWKLNVAIKAQSKAFLRGLRMLIPEKLLKIFSPHELQTLISGADKPIDIDDLRRHCNVNRHHFSREKEVEYLAWFWEVVQELDLSQQQNLLRFVTSCPRPPLLGFQSLYPKFGIQLLGANGDTKLPMAGTCFNLLRLPVYSTKQILKDKLVVAISAKAGFEIS